MDSTAVCLNVDADADAMVEVWLWDACRMLRSWMQPCYFHDGWVMTDLGQAEALWARESPHMCCGYLQSVRLARGRPDWRGNTPGSNEVRPGGFEGLHGGFGYISESAEPDPHPSLRTTAQLGGSTLSEYVALRARQQAPRKQFRNDSASA
ncbi:hypothetical protein K458DRAFT_189578 [Lentithecium fluviatile CBS 122367]|uniref:Uncharacterized protein n=1 Tax=Lentithecium fluviatile CBS 122367 TaxID=1168545 RepID=A0A6G1J9Z8_9PLEO|nr:hypothetical protein K458DRAFT_189578 [Lentithecium fluviatile CBS 122367]